MALNLADSKEIMAAYDAVLRGELSWFLLYYSNNTADEIALYAFGSEGVEELKTKIDPTDTQQVLVGFLRVEEEDLPLQYRQYLQNGVVESDEAKFLLVSYVPPKVMGVRRARAKVHSRRLGIIFKKHDAVLTIENVSQLLPQVLAQALAEPELSLLSFSTSTGQPQQPQQLSPISTDFTPIDNRPGSVVYSRPSTPLQASPTTIVPSNLQQYPPHTAAASEMQRSSSHPIPNYMSPLGTAGNTGVVATMNSTELRPAQRSASESAFNTVAPFTQQPQPEAQPMRQRQTSGTHSKIGSQLTNFLRRRKRSGSNAALVTPFYASEMGGRGFGDESQESEDSMPPPTPPKDKGIHAPHLGKLRKIKPDFGDYTPEGPLTLSHGLAPITESFSLERSMSDFAVVSHEELGRGRERDVVIVRPEELGEFGSHQPEKRLPIQPTSIDVLKKGKWATPEGLTAVNDPKERARLRMEMQRQKEEEEEAILRAEEERQVKIRREKAEFMKKEEEEAEYRRLKIQAEALRVAAERRRREELERLEEERRDREREERKREEKLKRIDEHLRLEEWRKEKKRAADAIATAEQEKEKREEGERLQKIRRVESDVKKKIRRGPMTGYVSVQTNETVVWRRRFFKFTPNTFYFYRNAKDIDKVTEELEVRGRVKALKEPKDGYEHLKAIPHSFAIEFYGREPWAMYCDTEEEKYELLALIQLHQ